MNSDQIKEFLRRAIGLFPGQLNDEKARVWRDRLERIEDVDAADEALADLFASDQFLSLPRFLALHSEAVIRKNKDHKTISAVIKQRELATLARQKQYEAQTQRAVEVVASMSDEEINAHWMTFMLPVAGNARGWYEERGPRRCMQFALWLLGQVEPDGKQNRPQDACENDTMAL